MKNKRSTELKMEFTRLGLVQADVAIETGIGETRLSRILNGRSKIRDHERSKLAEVLEMPVANLPV